MPLDIDAVRRRLPDRTLYYFRSVESTMHEASRLAETGCPSGTAVVADAQTAGQGRYGRNWHSAGGLGLYLSVVLRHSLPVESLPVLTLALGLATAEAIARATDIACDLRWPNDVMVGDKKVAGILVQLQDRSAIAGIGINVNQESFPVDIADLATSLRIASGRAHSRENLLATLLPAVDSFCKMLIEGGKEAILEMFCRCSTYARNKRVTVQQADGVVEGITAGVDPSGFLIVQKDDGSKTLILAGGVRAAGSRRG